MTFAGLKASVMDWLNRPDLESVIPAFIQSAEARLNRDHRLLQQTVRTPFLLTGESVALPTDLRTLDSLYLDGPVFYGPLHIVSGEALAPLRARRPSGPPTHVAVMGRRLYYAPALDADYAAWISYFRRIPALSDAEPTNWMLSAHPDIYRLAALAESAPYLKDDERLAMWEAMLNARLEDLYLATSQEMYSGSLVRRSQVLE